MVRPKITIMPNLPNIYHIISIIWFGPLVWIFGLLVSAYLFRMSFTIFGYKQTCFGRNRIYVFTVHLSWTVPSCAFPNLNFDLLSWMETNLCILHWTLSTANNENGECFISEYTLNITYLNFSSMPSTKCL